MNVEATKHIAAITTREGKKNNTKKKKAESFSLQLTDKQQNTTHR